MHISLISGGVIVFVSRGETFLSGTSLTQLEHLYAQEKHVKAKTRLQCAILRKKGESQPFIAEVTGLPVTTVSDILRRFEHRGVKGPKCPRTVEREERIGPCHSPATASR